MRPPGIHRSLLGLTAATVIWEAGFPSAAYAFANVALALDFALAAGARILAAVALALVVDFADVVAAAAWAVCALATVAAAVAADALDADFAAVVAAAAAVAADALDADFAAVVVATVCAALAAAAPA
jgi:hypothetical protein